MNVLELFAGAGGGILGGLLLGHRPVCAVEIDPYCRDVLLQRQRDGALPLFPIWDDVKTFDGRPWSGLVDIVSGGFPCQGISSANPHGKGLDDSRSGLWFAMARVIDEIQPRFAIVENSPRLARKGLSRVVGDLLALGYRCAWGILGAQHVGAPHNRDRLWLLAHTNKAGHGVCAVDGEMGGSCAPTARHTGALSDTPGSREPTARRGHAARPHRWPPEPAVSRVDDGLAHRVEWTRATGNGQVPAVHALAFRLLYQRLMGASL